MLQAMASDSPFPAASDAAPQTPHRPAAPLFDYFAEHERRLVVPRGRHAHAARGAAGPSRAAGHGVSARQLFPPKRPKKRKQQKRKKRKQIEKLEIAVVVEPALEEVSRPDDQAMAYVRIGPKQLFFPSTDDADLLPTMRLVQKHAPHWPAALGALARTLKALAHVFDSCVCTDGSPHAFVPVRQKFAWDAGVSALHKELIDAEPEGVGNMHLSIGDVHSACLLLYPLHHLKNTVQRTTHPAPLPKDYMPVCITVKQAVEGMNAYPTLDYARLRLGYRADGQPVYEYVHRLALWCLSGPPPEGHEACHMCHNTWCINPHHLCWGLQSLNLKFEDKSIIIAAHGGTIPPHDAAIDANLRNALMHIEYEKALRERSSLYMYYPGGGSVT
jgi:HNH endonuclease